ncbi:alpha/beta hydrolase [Companilactobacillus kimchiensis]|uniref:Alpha beta fold family hydrolase n=1 Tax=Companilactobacillus kimchiensis TaxID=993692 RepID=A0A0R2L843_9LACO|nr:alpha/beta hydrolase [Companilactobacillus kimchiensis]KRN97601.1 alpha beta fold family hydrolase [Companilactobacillus kimchiensis]
MIIILLILLLLVVLILNAFFLYIQKRGSKALGAEAPKVKMDEGLVEKTAEFVKKDKQMWQIQSTYNGSHLHGWFTDNNDDVTVIMVHGFGVDHNSLNVHAQLFDSLGCNVLQIDNQAAGQSDGKYLGFGYIESLDLINWINKVLSVRPHDKIILFGASMGAATVMLTSGNDLPKNVKLIIEDSGYTSATDILSYHCQKRYHIKGRALIAGISLMSRVRAGFSYRKTDCRSALEKNSLPILFMHGKNDFTVPFKMRDELSTCGQFPKMSYESRGVHIRSYYVDSRKYHGAVEKFLKMYL